MDFSSDDKIADCETTIAYTFRNKALCAEALNAAADIMAYYHDGQHGRHLPKNDRLAIYGDSVAATLLCREWYRTGSEKGKWDFIRKEALGNKSLAQKGFAHKLDACITRNSGTASVSAKMMATAVEAILGAVHLDGGVVALADVMARLNIADPFHDSVHFVNALMGFLAGPITSPCEFEVFA